MLFNNNPKRNPRFVWRALPIVAVLLVYPLLNACGKSSSGNNDGTAATAPAQKEPSASEAGGGMGNGMMGKEMGSGMGNGMMHNGTGDSSQATQTAQASSDTGTAAASQATQTAQASSDTSAASGSQTETKTAQKEQKREPMDGYTVYSRFCVVCHKAGMNGAPKYGDKRAWAPRVAQGKETMYHAAIHGLRAMPAKGGIAGLYDQEVKDAVDYMVNGSGGWGNTN
jgi:cytochrome c5